MPQDVGEVVRELFRFGTEQGEVYDAITGDPSFVRVQAELQDDAIGEHAETVPSGFSPELWNLYYAYQSTAALAMYRAWVADSKAIPVEEAVEHAACLICRGSDAWLAGVRSCA